MDVWVKIRVEPLANNSWKYFMGLGQMGSNLVRQKLSVQTKKWTKRGIFEVKWGHNGPLNGAEMEAIGVIFRIMIFELAYFLLSIFQRFLHARKCKWTKIKSSDNFQKVSEWIIRDLRTRTCQSGQKYIRRTSQSLWHRPSISVDQVITNSLAEP